jgi:cytochrome oxidase Cu insertion factor (SCO1/SenC/PrrC family)
MKYQKLILLVLFLIAGILITACGNSASDQISIGASAPDFTLNSSEGTPVSLSDYKGQPVLLFFHMAEG